MLTKTLKEKRFTVKPFRNVRIGDPYYFKEMINGSTNKSLKTITCNFDKIPVTKRIAGARIQEIEYDYSDEGENLKYTSIELMFFTSKKEEFCEKIIETELSGSYYPNHIKKQYELGCDTARFEIQIDENYDVIHTGSDGYYGYAHHYKNNDAFVFCVTFDGGLFSWEDVERYVAYFFVVTPS